MIEDDVPLPPRRATPQTTRGLCVVEGCSNLQGANKAGTWRALCQVHHRLRYKMKSGGIQKPYRRKKGLHCERCGPDVIYSRVQLDVHHRDGNHSNNTPSNLATLCANCHRLVHHG